MTASPTREDALLPCPFCGKVPEIDNLSEDDVVHGVVTDECPLGGMYIHKDKWNTRAGIVIDRDKVPVGLKEALEGTKSTAVVDNLDKLMLWDEHNETVRKAAALLAEKVGE